MNYLAQGIESGLRIGADAYQKRKDREQQTALDKARRDLELERDASRYKSEKDRQDTQIAAEAKRQFDQNAFTSGRDSTLNTYDGQKLDKTQGFSAGQSKLDRDARERADQRRLKQDAAALASAKDQFNRTEARQYAQLGLSATNAQRDDERRTDPNNPEIQIRNETLAKLKRENADAAGGPLGGSSPAKMPAANSTKPTPIAIDYLKKNPGTADQFRRKYGLDPADYLGR